MLRAAAAAALPTSESESWLGLSTGNAATAAKYRWPGGSKFSQLRRSAVERLVARLAY